MIAGNRVIAVEEHSATEAFLQAAHDLAVVPGDQTEMDLIRAVERAAPMRSRLTDLDARVREMDTLGQDMAVLSLNPPGVQPYQPAAAVALAREFNDALAGIVRRRPDRFGGLGAVAPQDPKAAAEEIQRVMGPLGLNGIMINSHTGGHYLDEPRFARIDNRHAFASRVAGAATPMPKLDLTPSEYFRRNFVLTISGIDDPDVLGLGLRAVGDDNIMFAIDYPYEEPAPALAFLRDAQLTDTQRANMSHRAAERVFALP
jgi:predicted TIM-barrel fold metal-dependent hydrolase